MKKRVLIGAGVVLLLAVAAAAGAWFWNEGQTADVRGAGTTTVTTLLADSNERPILMKSRGSCPAAR